MKRALARCIVRYRLLILILLLLAAAWSVPGISHTRINYDLTRYLSENTMTRRALEVMNRQFGSTEQLSLIFRDQDEEVLSGYAGRLETMEEIRAVQHDPESDTVRKDGITWQQLTLTLQECDTAVLVKTLRNMFPEAGEYLVDGSAARQLDVQRSVGNEIPGVMAIAVMIVLLVLLLTSHAWLEPLVLLVVFAVSILINMGTNFLFPDVSFITFAVCAILQLALSIDYAIMLLHTWNSCCDSGMTPEDAMTEALCQCFMRITSSALTTLAGLLSLLFMSFTIGFDIGLVLSKGILISMLGVFLLMPALTLLLKAPLLRTRHKPLHLGGEHLAGLILKYIKPLAVLLILAVGAGAFMTSRNTYTFTEPNAVPSSPGAASGVFEVPNPLVLLVPSGEEDADYDLQRQLVRDLEFLKREDGSPALRNIAAMVTTGEAALRYYTPADVAELIGVDEEAIAVYFTFGGLGDSVRADRLLAMAENLLAGDENVAALKSRLDTAREVFIGKDLHRLILTPAFSASDRDFSACMKSVLDVAGKYYEDRFYATGGPMSAYDIGNAFHGDLMRVNLITLLAILLIVILSFHSLLLPLLLVFVIEGAIWLNMGLSFLLGQPVFFISYLICLSIQMGATIDYGILLCDQYRMQRQAGLPAGEALTEALRKALPTVMTSGLILITAGYVIGRQCSIYYISSIGLLISRGALTSVLLVLTLLPALLVLADRRIIKPRLKKR